MHLPGIKIHQGEFIEDLFFDLNIITIFFLWKFCLPNPDPESRIQRSVVFPFAAFTDLVIRCFRFNRYARIMIKINPSKVGWKIWIYKYNPEKVFFLIASEWDFLFLLSLFRPRMVGGWLGWNPLNPHWVPYRLK